MAYSSHLPPPPTGAGRATALPLAPLRAALDGGGRPRAAARRASAPGLGSRLSYVPIRAGVGKLSSDVRVSCYCEHTTQAATYCIAQNPGFILLCSYYMYAP